VHPGYSGQKFMPEAIAKVAQVRKQLDIIKSSAWLEVDGGINLDTLPLMKRAGATAFVAATAVFKHPGGIEVGIRSLKDVIASS
jgi:ribulose-phosphate 3-epimerase